MKLRSKSSIYHVEKVLSEGEQSVVCEAYRKDLSYPVAQKILLKIFNSKSSLYPLELESLIKVRSPYCVSVLHFDQIENKPVLILEWIQAINLFQLVRQSPLLNPLEISYICWNVQQGLLDLRKHGMCHGDLSWSNVLIDREGVVKLIDFGKGNYIGKEIFSTPLFTAPEVTQGSLPDFHSDLFSLGVLETLLQNPLLNSEETDSSFVLERHPLLDPLPQNRKAKEYICDESAKTSLARKVNHVFELNLKKQKGLQLFKTQRKKLFSPLFIYLGFFIFSFMGSKGVSHPRSSVSVRSQQWMKVSIGEKTGFTPFNSGLLEEGVYLLKWETATKKGSFKVYLKDKEHILLNNQKLKSF